MDLDYASEVRRIAAQARVALDQHDYRESLRLYDELVFLDQNDPRWRRRRIDAVYLSVLELPDSLSRFAEAIRRLEVAAAAPEADSLSHFELGYGYMVLAPGDQDFEERALLAHREFELARSTAPSNLGGWWGLITLAELEPTDRKANRDRAVELAAQATIELPTESRAWLLLATTRLSRSLSNEIGRAISDLEHALRLDGNNAEALLLMADLQLAHGFVDRAIAAYHRVIAVESGSWLAKAAQSQLDRIRDRGPNDAGTAYGIFVTPDGDRPPPTSPAGHAMPLPPWIPAFRSWPRMSSSRCRTILFESAW